MNKNEFGNLERLMVYVKAMEETIKQSPIGEFYQLHFPAELEKALKNMKHSQKKSE